MFSFACLKFGAFLTLLLNGWTFKMHISTFWSFCIKSIKKVSFFALNFFRLVSYKTKYITDLDKLHKRHDGRFRLRSNFAKDKAGLQTVANLKSGGKHNNRATFTEDETKSLMIYLLPLSENQTKLIRHVLISIWTL